MARDEDLRWEYAAAAFLRSPSRQLGKNVLGARDVVEHHRSGSGKTPLKISRAMRASPIREAVRAVQVPRAFERTDLCVIERHGYKLQHLLLLDTLIWTNLKTRSPTFRPFSPIAKGIICSRACAGQERRLQPRAGVGGAIRRKALLEAGDPARWMREGEVSQ